jgi:hypothetical protein
MYSQKLIPFHYEISYSKSINCISFDNVYAYAGTSTGGVILRSKDRFVWEDFIRLNDESVTSIVFLGNFLFAGTSPNGRIYRISLSGENYFLDAEFGGEVNGFAILNSELYCALSSPAEVYKFDFIRNSWSIFYRPYGKKINQFSSYFGKLFLSLDTPNILSYDGKKWSIEISDNDNASTIRKVSKNIFSHQTYEFIDSKQIKETSELSDEDILDIYPINKSIGFGSFALDGDSLTLGASNFGRVYNYQNEEITTIYDTDKKSVSNIINLDIGVNLVSMENGLYITHCGKIEKEQVVVSEDEEDPNLGKTVYIISPNGGENIVIGSTYEITWSSNRSINDSIKLSLYNGDDEVVVINNNAPNNGLYLWETPISLTPGGDYKIYIEWISASDEPNENDKDFSDNSFSFTFSEVEQVENEPQKNDVGLPDLSECRGIPILFLNNEENITYMTKDPYGGILIATSMGRIIFTYESYFNSYMSGNRIIYANVRSGYGASSEDSLKSFFYSLHKRLIKINSEKEIEQIRYLENALAVPSEEVSAIFISKILNAEDDFGFWKKIIWSEQKPEKSKITVCIRVGEDISDIQRKEWDICFNSIENEPSPIERELNNVNLRGKYAQIKVIMKAVSTNDSPSLLNVNLIYSSKKAQYFFTVKFALENSKNVNQGLLTGTISEPINTEVLFGYSDTNSSNWEDYKIIDPNSFFGINNIENIKVGIKMVSYDNSLPQVDEFSIIYGGDKIIRDY